jgi:hypothetical protein
MKKAFTFIASSVSLLAVFGSSTIQAQSPAAPATETRSRTVEPERSPARSQDPAGPNLQDGNGEEDRPKVNAVTPPNAIAEKSSVVQRQLSPNIIRTRIAEAERLFRTRPRQTALTSPALDIVTLALLDPGTSRIHSLALAKTTFLSRGTEVTMTTSLGTPVTLRVLRANGVNTAVTVVDNFGHSLVPLTVEFPIEHNGVFREMAYYTSAHPALLSPELVRTGQAYVHSMIDLAVKRLREKGAFIAPNIVDVAERLCLVEHVDHDRFKNENRAALFGEIYSLYALNQPETYRYSVSIAGAGGMVQMIPWAYNLERQRHPGVGLMPDFVAGMRNHGNALQAMLLYMQDTWNDLSTHEDVKSALDAKIATPTELLAAGYNSNAAKLPAYLRRGGTSWRTLIPRETQIYLQIYHALEGAVPARPRVSAGSVSDN